MPHKPVRFRETEVRRAIRGVREEGLDIESVEVTKDGFVIHTAKLITTNEDAAKQWARATEELTAPKPVPKTATVSTKRAKGKR